MAWTDYRSRPILADYTVTSIGANQTLYGPTTGSVTDGSGTIKLTDNSVSSTVVPAGYVWDALEIEIISPVASDGTYPDAVIWFTNGTGNSSENTLYLDASYGGNMFPRAKLTRGQKSIRLGYSTRDLILANARRAEHGGGVQNLPLKITGLKVSDQLTMNVLSVAGWSTPNVPLRVIVRGDVLGTNDVAKLNGLPFNGEIHVSVPPAPDFYATHQFGGNFSLASWSTLPGGENQSGVKVNRRINFAYNNQQITSDQYVFSNKNSLQGGSLQVVKSQNDLGYYYKNSDNLFLPQEFGCNIYVANTQAYLGMLVDDQIVPKRTTTGGTLISTGNNDFAYGAVSQNGQGPATSAEYDRIPGVDVLGQFVAYKNALVPVVIAANGGTIAKNDVSIAQGGVQVIQG